MKTKPDLIPDYRARSIEGDPSINLIVFEIQTPAGLEKITVEGLSRAEDFVRQAWDELEKRRGLDPLSVTRLYSEWEPSAADKEFVALTFSAPLTFTLPRPTADGWEEALRQGGAAIRNAIGPRGNPDAIPDPNNEFAGKKGPIKFLFVTAAVCAAAIAGGIWEFNDLGELETRGGAISVNVFVGLIYNILGRYGVLAISLLIGFGSGYLFSAELYRCIAKKKGNA